MHMIKNISINDNDGDVTLYVGYDKWLICVLIYCFQLIEMYSKREDTFVRFCWTHVRFCFVDYFVFHARGRANHRNIEIYIWISVFDAILRSEHVPVVFSKLLLHSLANTIGLKAVTEVICAHQIFRNPNRCVVNVRLRILQQKKTNHASFFW